MFSIKKTNINFLFYSLLITCIANAQFRVTLDAGHGGHDPGTGHFGIQEKNIALAVVLKVGAILDEHPNILIKYTRKTDEFIDLVERANIANRFNSNIFVSVHCNANPNAAADGTETYVMGMTKNASSLAVAKAENEVVTLEKDYKQKYKGFDPNSPESMIGMTILQEEFLLNSISLASNVEDEFAKIGKKIRGEGVKQAPYMVLHKASMTRILIEMGFISNQIESQKLNSVEGQNEIAEAIAKAIISYKKEYYDGGDIDSNSIQKQKEEFNNNRKDTVRTVIAKHKPKNQKPEIAIIKNKDTAIKETKNQKIEIAVIKKDTAVISKTNNKTDVSTENNIVYKVQIAAGDKNINLTPKNFKGLENVTMYTENSTYKYCYGAAESMAAIKEALKIAKSKGYKTAFVIKFIDGKRQ